ncbi:MAG: FtsX-like permease family protein [Phycisphaeraceae bacterium]|nr:MAG: FtsX-like permease family protein [Phycisphaeraceae bacterium]
MRPALRLAINNLWGRKPHALLLIAAVSLSCALVVTVASLISSVNASVRLRMESTIGSADLRLESSSSNGLIDAAWLRQAVEWPETLRATPALERTLVLRAVLQELVPDADGIHRKKDRLILVTAATTGLTPERAAGMKLLAGRMPEAPDEVVLDALLAERFSIRGESLRTSTANRGIARLGPPKPGEARPTLPETIADAELAARLNAGQRVLLGDTVVVTRLLRPSMPLRVVGIAPQPPLGGRPQAYLLLSSLASLSDAEGKLSRVDIELRPGLDPESTVDARRQSLPESILLQTTAKVTSGLDENLRSSELGLVLAIVLSTLAASFIILTGLTTDVARRQRELAVLRCIGASRGQLAGAQVWAGAIVGSIGAVVGLGLGLLIAWAVATIRADALGAGLHVPPLGVTLGVAGAFSSGLIGAAWPAWRTSRVSPLEGMTLRARPVSRGAGRGVAIAATVMIVFGFLVVSVPTDGQVIFWAYATCGLPLVFIGYFLLGTPVVLLVSRATSGLFSRAAGLPRGLLAKSIAATPFRNGFTAGALMTGVSIMTVIWTNGGAVMRDWLDKLEFPDAFVSGVALPEEAEERLRQLPCVAETCAIGLQFVDTDAFGVRALQSYKTSFIAFEPEPFFRMAKLTWIEGSLETALPRLQQGGAVIVAREFLVAQGMGVGDTFTCAVGDESHVFEIVGVVTSPGLEVVSKFFNISEDYTNQALHAVFGTRADMKRLFNNDSVQLIQIDLRPEWDDESAMDMIREALADIPILDAGSGRRIREEIRTYVLSGITIMTAVALFAMIICSLGVANLVIASIEIRKFEFGILRAVGAQRGLLVRLVLAEVITIAVAGAIIGTVLGLQAAWSEQKLMRLLLGLGVEFRPSLPAIAGAWGMLIVTCVIASAPAVRRLGKREPRELLAAARG